MIVCGTGHRGKDLPSGWNDQHPWAIKIKTKIIQWLIENNPTTVISGMALSYDTWLAEATLMANIDLHCYLPFEGQEKTWPKASQDRYHKILKQAQKSVCIYSEFNKQSYLDRNKAMVDNSDLVLALWNPTRQEGGTYHCICYAQKQNKKIVNLWEN